MPVETAEYVASLDKRYPSGGESISEGDDHLRLIKGATAASFPEIKGPVTATHAELNQVPTIISDVAELKIVADGGHGNVASCYYKNGSKLYSHNVGTITATPGNVNGTRVNFSSTLQGGSPESYAFSVTPVAKDEVGRPILVTVSNVTAQYIDFIAMEFTSFEGDWQFLPGATVDFSLTVQDMDAGQ